VLDIISICDTRRELFGLFDDHLVLKLAGVQQTSANSGRRLQARENTSGQAIYRKLCAVRQLCQKHLISVGNLARLYLDMNTAQSDETVKQRDTFQGRARRGSYRVFRCLVSVAAAAVRYAEV